MTFIAVLHKPHLIVKYFNAVVHESTAGFYSTLTRFHVVDQVYRKISLINVLEAKTSLSLVIQSPARMQNPSWPSFAHFTPFGAGA